MAATPAERMLPQLDLSAEHAEIESELIAAASEVIRSGHYILGRPVAAFEDAVASFLGVAGAVGVSSGTDALLVSLMALGVGPGDEVIVPTFTFFATAGIVSRLGATPVFVDVDPRTYNLCPKAAKVARTARTRAVIPVHLFGQRAALEDIAAALEGVPMIEDAAQAFGVDGDLVGKAACHSFFPSKNLGGFGDGGMVVSDDEEFLAHVRRLRAHGAAPKYFHAEVGGNFRLDAMQAALLSVKLPRVSANLSHRANIAASYHEALASLSERGLQRPTQLAPHSWNQYVVRVPARDTVRAALAAKGIATAVYYPRCLHQQVCFEISHSGQVLPVAERAAAEVLALPMGPHLSRVDVDRVAECLGRALTSLVDRSGANE